MKVTVYVTPKATVLDPQGAAVEQAIQSLSYANAQDVRVGKMITFTLREEDNPKIRSALDKLCGTFLSNPVIEDYRYEISEA